MQAQASSKLSDERPVVHLWNDTGNDIFLNSQGAPHFRILQLRWKQEGPSSTVLLQMSVTSQAWSWK